MSDSARALDQQPLAAELVGEVAAAGRAQRRLRLLGLAIEQIDHRKPGRDLRARRALQAVVDLMLQQLRRLIEQIDRDQPVGEPADHLVAAPADRRELAEIVEQAERIDRRQRVALAGEEQLVEGRRRLVLDAARHVRIRVRAQRGAHDVERVAVAALLGVERASSCSASTSVSSPRQAMVSVSRSLMTCAVFASPEQSQEALRPRQAPTKSTFQWPSIATSRIRLANCNACGADGSAFRIGAPRSRMFAQRLLVTRQNCRQTFALDIGDGHRAWNGGAAQSSR